MTDDAKTFLNHWVAEHINGEPYVGSSDPDPRPARYASQCQGDAEKAGLTAEQLGAAASDMHGAGSLEAFMTIEIDICAQKRHHELIGRAS